MKNSIAIGHKESNDTNTCHTDIYRVYKNELRNKQLHECANIQNWYSNIQDTKIDLPRKEK